MARGPGATGKVSVVACCFPDLASWVMGSPLHSDLSCGRQRRGKHGYPTEAPSSGSQTVPALPPQALKILTQEAGPSPGVMLLVAYRLETRAEVEFFWEVVGWVGTPGPDRGVGWPQSNHQFGEVAWEVRRLGAGC